LLKSNKSFFRLSFLGSIEVVVLQLQNNGWEADCIATALGRPHSRSVIHADGSFSERGAISPECSLQSLQMTNPHSASALAMNASKFEGFWG